MKIKISEGKYLAFKYPDLLLDTEEMAFDFGDNQLSKDIVAQLFSEPKYKNIVSEAVEFKYRSVPDYSKRTEAVYDQIRQYEKGLKLYQESESKSAIRLYREHLYKLMIKRLEVGYTEHLKSMREWYEHHNLEVPKEYAANKKQILESSLKTLERTLRKEPNNQVLLSAKKTLEREIKRLSA